MRKITATELMNRASPILFVGAPRSGTTITFEHFALHPDLAWISNYARIFPKFAPVNLLRRVLDNPLISLRGRKNQFGDLGWVNRYLPRPDESYEFWGAYACPDFAKSYLLNGSATEAEASDLREAMHKAQRYQGKSRITAKLTGPGRISYLHSIWPQMHVVHVIRDGLDVVRSLLNVGFWKNNGGYREPWWEGGLEDDELEAWRSRGSDPGELAAIQWRRIVETTRAEAQTLLAERYTELRYEHFLAHSVKEIERLYRHVYLPVEVVELPLLAPRNRTYDREWSPEYIMQLVECMQPVYSSLNYDIDARLAAATA